MREGEIRGHEDSRIASCSLLLFWGDTSAGSRGSCVEQEAAWPEAELSSLSVHQVVTPFLSLSPGAHQC